MITESFGKGMFSFIEPARIYFKKPVWFFTSTTILWVYHNSSPIYVVLGSSVSALHMVRQHMTSGLALDFQLLFSCSLILVRIFSTYGCLCNYICESKLCALKFPLASMSYFVYTLLTELMSYSLESFVWYSVASSICIWRIFTEKTFMLES